MKDISDLQVLRAFERYKANPDPWNAPYDYLMDETGQPFDACYRAMERAYDQGLIEFGTSLRSGWVTDKGRELLASDT